MNRMYRLRNHLVSQTHSICLWTILLIHGFLLGWISLFNAPTFDEIGHLPAGLSHWQLGNFELYRVNPPLMRMISAIPLVVANPQTQWTWNSQSLHSRDEFVIGRTFMQLNGNDSFWYFTWGRWAQIPVSLLGGWICFHWARDIYGLRSGFVAVLLWCSCPNILAWGSTITPDLGAAAFGVTAVYSYWRWLKNPEWLTALAAGATLGLAELSKSTWIVLFILYPAIWCCWVWNHNSQFRRPPARQLICLILFSGYILNVGYAFENSFRSLGRFAFISNALGGKGSHIVPGNRFRDTLFGSLPIPLPANYVSGIDVQKCDFEAGKWSYFCGEQRFGGWYHYYIYALAIKTPIGTLCLLVIAAYLILRCYGQCFNLRDESILLLPALIVIAVVSSQTGFNRYLRYVLPAIPFLYIFASRAARAFELNSLLPKAICGIAVTSSVIGSLSVFPHSMSYFNILAGGPTGGPKHLLDANIDWGQDLLRLKQFVDIHPEVRPIRLAYFGYADPALAEFLFEPIEQSSVHGDQLIPQPGWYAISVNHLFGYRHYESDRPVFTEFQRFSPKYKMGYSIYIYHITPEEIRAIYGSETAATSETAAE